MHWIRLSVFTLIFALLSSLCFADEFPYRKVYPDVLVIELADLKAGYDDGSFMMVDVRSDLEFDTIHPKGAHHLSLFTLHFAKELQSLSAHYLDKKIALYCNGILCTKSYKATEIAMKAGMKNVYVFDAGVPGWANAYPAETLLVGKKITDPEKQLIPKSELAKVTVDFETFKKKAAAANAVVIDARDPRQRTKSLPGFEKALHVPLDKLIKNIISQDRMKDKQLVIFDQVGKQVIWLMYYLENKGYKNYYFLKGGATSVLKEQVYRD